MHSNQPHVESILVEYDATNALAHQFLRKSAELIDELLEAAGLRVHSIEKRVKDRAKLEEKIARPGKDYKCLDEVKDVVGLRVITYFEDDVDTVSGLIKREFDLLEEHTEDKRKSHLPNQFGYLSLHHVCRLSKRRLRETENKKFKSSCFEIQIRSLLQHAWAEIEHDLGYKSGAESPAVVRRRFSQLAGLLEIADREFREIRTTLVEYEKKASARLSEQPKKSSKAPPLDDLDVDTITVSLLIKQDADIRSINEVISKASGRPVAAETTQAAWMAQLLTSVGIFFVPFLLMTIRENQEAILEYAKLRDIQLQEVQDVDPVLGLMLVCEILAYWRAGEKGILQLYKEHGIGDEAKQKIAAKAHATIASKITWPFRLVWDSRDTWSLPE